MERKLLVEDAFGLLRVALLEDGRLVECRVEEAGGKNRAGSIYKGRVKNILPGMQAAFVDIGQAVDHLVEVDAHADGEHVVVVTAEGAVAHADEQHERARDDAVDLVVREAMLLVQV